MIDSKRNYNTNNTACRNHSGTFAQEFQVCFIFGLAQIQITLKLEESSSMVPQGLWS